MTYRIVMSPIQEDHDMWNGLCIALTSKCNMECGYCSRNSSPSKKESLELNRIKKILDLFSKTKPRKTKYLQLTGGEVFMYPKIICVLEYALKLGFVCRIQTNGLLLSEMFKKYPKILSSNRVIIKVSLDGWSPETHGFFRGYKTFYPIVEGVKVALNHNPLVGLKTVICDNNFNDIQKMLDFCLSLKARGWSYNTLMIRGRSKVGTKITELDVAKKLVPIYNQLRYCKLLNGSNIQIYFWMKYAGWEKLPPYFFINFDGDVYVTDHAIEERKIGSIYKDNLADQFDASQVINKLVPTVSCDLLDYVYSNLNVSVKEPNR